MPRTLPKKASKTVETATVPTETPVVHDVHLLDGSGSMNGDKFNNAVRGINSDIVSSSKASKDFGTTGTYSVLQFDEELSFNMNGNFTYRDINNSIEYAPRFLNGWTAVYDAIYNTIQHFLSSKKSTDRVLLKVFTDGMDNRSKIKPTQLAELIRNVEKNHNFTVTFVGTQQDVGRITKLLSIDASNSLVHDNTASGIAAAFLRTEESSVQYRKSLSRGEDVSTNFYGKSMENK